MPSWQLSRAWEDGEQSGEIQANGRALIILETQGKQHFVPWHSNWLERPCQIPQTLPNPILAARATGQDLL